MVNVGQAPRTANSLYCPPGFATLSKAVRRETSNVKGFGGRAFGSPAFHLLRLTFHIF